jgi:hypothetical protein
MEQRSDCWALASAAMDFLLDDLGDDPTVQNLLLHGPPGTGKSHFAQTYRLPARAELCRVYLTEDTPATDLRGGPLPEGEGWRWVHGPAVRAWQQGTRLVIDEVDKASADALTFLLAVLDDRPLAGFTLPTGEVVRPAPGFHAVATTNAEPADLPEALRDRFTIAIAIDEPHPQAIGALGRDLRAPARVTAALEPERRVSIRGWRAFDQLRDRGGEQLAATLVFGSRAPDVLDALRIGADAERWEPPPPCYWSAKGACTGDGRGIYVDRDGDPACADCALRGRSPAPIVNRAGETVRGD